MFMGPHGPMMMAPANPHAHGAPTVYPHPASHPYGMMMFGPQYPSMMHPQHAQFYMQNHAAAVAAAATAANASHHPSIVPSLLGVPSTSAQFGPPSDSLAPVINSANTGNEASVDINKALSDSRVDSHDLVGPATDGEGAGNVSTVTGDVPDDVLTTVGKRARMDLEKDELIREFKKKTREAALVRFRQKRSERRFGKLIRYDCRKKLADARPRIKGRFVRIRLDELGEEDSECAQVVPDFER